MARMDVYKHLYCISILLTLHLVLNAFWTGLKVGQ